MVTYVNLNSSKNIYFLKRSQINNITFHLKTMEKEEQIKCHVSIRKDIIKFKVEINEIETGNQLRKINEPQSWFFEKIDKLVNF